MEVYILNDFLLRVDVIDVYESFIWTERWAEMGDFELVVQATPQNRRRLLPGTRLAHHKSFRVMTIETVEIKEDDDGRIMLTVKGPSLEQMLDDRIASDGVSKEWILTGTAGSIARQIFHQICREGSLNISDKIPHLTVGSVYPLSTIPESELSYSAAIPISTVYEAIVEICEAHDMGFRLIRNPAWAAMYFDVYTGDDRTTLQTTFKPIVFSPDLDNLTNITELTSIAQTKNVAYVIGLNDSIIVYGEGADETTAGFNRRVLYIDATDIEDPAGPELTSILTNKGLDALSKTRPLSAFDGEINQNSEHKYGIDYHLGDLVEMRSIDGGINHMRVTEQIFVSDAEGERSYPSLTVKRFIAPEAWDAYDVETWDGGDQFDTWDSDL